MFNSPCEYVYMSSIFTANPRPWVLVCTIPDLIASLKNWELLWILSIIRSPTSHSHFTAAKRFSNISCFFFFFQFSVPFVLFTIYLRSPVILCLLPSRTWKRLGELVHEVARGRDILEKAWKCMNVQVCLSQSSLQCCVCYSKRTILCRKLCQIMSKKLNCD